jgi:DNA-binding CsgD family transcriptional regulator
MTLTHENFLPKDMFHPSDVAQKSGDANDLLWGSLLDSIPVGIITLDADSFVLRRNSTAAALLDQEDGLHIYKGRLRASTAHHSFMLTSAVRHLERQVASTTQPTFITTLQVPCRVSDRGIEVVLKRAPRVESGNTQATVVIAYVFDPNRCKPSSPQLIASLYRLTPAETKLTIHLMQGNSLEVAAGLLRVKKDTVRKHLQAIFSKTRTSRQADLIRLLMMGAAQLEV